MRVFFNIKKPRLKGGEVARMYLLRLAMALRPGGR